MSSEPQRRRSYKYLDLVTAVFVTVLLCSNLIGPGKLVEFHLFGFLIVFGAGNIFFPISYIFDDVLTEVYGYAKARKVIWAGFGAMVFATFMAWVVIHLPNHFTGNEKADGYQKALQPSLELVFGNTWRIVAASMVAFWAGDFANSYVLAKMKILTGGRWLWTRTIGSTIVGEGLDSLVFYPIAFFGVWTNGDLARSVIFNWCFKVLVEVLMTPATYAVCGWLKRAEHEDFYDRETDFNPFSLKD